MTLFTRALFIFLIISIPLSNKKSNEIIKERKSTQNELKKLNNQIKRISTQKQKLTENQINTTSMLIMIEKKILLTEKLIRSYDREEKIINKNIDVISRNIEANDNTIKKLKSDLSSMINHVYKNGQNNIITNIIESNDWNEFIYKTKYLMTISKVEKNKKRAIINTQTKLNKDKIDLEKSLNKKLTLKKKKLIEKNNLANDKKKKNVFLKKLEKEKKSLDKELKEKSLLAKGMEKVIVKLLKDEKSALKREQSLAKKRSQKNKKISGNFSKMKGKLKWPVSNPRVISKFGKNKTPLGAIIDNAGIDITTNKNNQVVSVLDGVVSMVTFIRGFGNIIIIDHGDKFSTVYAMVESIQVSENEYVNEGSIIAKVSTYDKNTSKGILHFEVWGNQKKMNPQKWLKKRK